MQPTQRDLHVDTLLTNISIGYSNPEYIADRIFPIVPVMKRSDLIPGYKQSFWFRNEAKKRAPGTKSVRGGYDVVDPATYYCHRYSFGREIDDDTRANADAPYNLDREATEFVTDKMQMNREVNFAADFFATSKWATDKTGGSDFTQFSDYATSDPLGVVDGYRDDVEAKIGREPTDWVIGKQVWLKLKWHPDLIDLIKYVQRGVLSVELAASMFELRRILIGRSIYTTTPEGTAEGSVTYTRIWGKKGLLLYVPENPSLMTPAAGYTFMWRVVPNALQYIKRMRDEEREVDIIEGNSYFDQKITESRAGLFMDSVVA